MNRLRKLAMAAAFVLVGLSASCTKSTDSSPKEVHKMQLGFVSVCFGFDPVAKEDGGDFVYVEGLKRIQALAGDVKINAIQVPLFPNNIDESGFPLTQELFKQLREHVTTVVPILMHTTDPLNPENRPEFEQALYNGLMKAGELGASVCSSTSFEAWMKATQEKADPLSGKALEDSIGLLIDIHASVISRALADGCKVHHLDMEYLRTIEYGTFTNAEIAWKVISGINKKIRLGRSFVRLLDDSAHAGDSGLTVERINKVRALAREAGAYGTFHFSEPTTRGKLGSSSYPEEGLRDAARHGSLSAVFVEIFDPEGPEFDLMREHIPGFGVKTFDDIEQAIADGIVMAKGLIDQLAQ
jgi:hypothetical protein